MVIMNVLIRGRRYALERDRERQRESERERESETERERERDRESETERERERYALVDRAATERLGGAGSVAGP